MSVQAAQETLELPGLTRPTPGPVKPATRAARRQQRPLHAVPPTAVRYQAPRLTVDAADHQTHQALTDAGLRHQVSRVLTTPASHLPDCLATVALLRHGADPAAVHTALLGLSGVESSHRGQASVSIYRRVIT